MADNQKEQEGDAKQYKCLFCDYRAKTGSLLSRHINHYHKEVRAQTPKHLLTALSNKKTLPEMLTAVAAWVENATTFDEKLPDDVITYLRREDAKTQLILRVIAISKIQRALELGDKMKELDGVFSEKLEELKKKKDVTPQEYLGLLERLQSLQSNELNFLKEVSQLGEVNLNDIVDKLVTAFGTARLGSNPVGLNALQLINVNLPDDPAERETMRKILEGLTGHGKKDEHNGRRPNKAIEAEVKEDSGSDTQAD